MKIRKCLVVLSLMAGLLLIGAKSYAFDENSNTAISTVQPIASSGYQMVRDRDDNGQHRGHFRERRPHYKP